MLYYNQRKGKPTRGENEMTTTESITISADTIQQILALHEAYEADYEKTPTNENKAAKAALEAIMSIIGIEEQEDTNYCGKAFARELEALQSKTRKTGVFFRDYNERQRSRAESNKCSCLGAGEVSMDWYLTRTKDRKPVIRVKWYFPTLASRQVYKNGWVSREMTWACTNREKKFPFTKAGYEAACKYYDSLMAE